METMKWYLMIALFSLSIVASAQDVMFMSDGSKQETKVLEVGTESIRYKKHNNLTGPDYVVAKAKVVLIIFENGVHEVISTTSKTASTVEDTANTSFGKSLISFNVMDILLNRISFGYERIFAKGKIGLKIPIGVGFLENTSSNLNTKWISGLDLHYYPMGQRKVSYFTGFSFAFGQELEDSYLYGSNGYQRVINNVNFYGFYLNNGVYFKTGRNIGLSLNFGIGLKELQSRPSEELHPHVNGGVNMIFRF
jgi:hypothetical protein